jgi:hypothetical protein
MLATKIEDRPQWVRSDLTVVGNSDAFHGVNMYGHSEGLTISRITTRNTWSSFGVLSVGRGSPHYTLIRLLINITLFLLRALEHDLHVNSADCTVVAPFHLESYPKPCPLMSQKSALEKNFPRS